MKKIIILFAFILTTSKAFSILGSSNLLTGVASEVTQILNNASLVAQYAQQVQEYRAQLEQLKADVENLDLVKIASKVFDLSVYDDLFESTDQYGTIYDFSGSRTSVNNVNDFSYWDVSGRMDSATFISKIEASADKQISISKSRSDFSEAQLLSLEEDKISLEKIEAANDNAKGAMEAHQISNELNAQMVSQLIKTREEHARLLQLDAEREALQAEEEAMKKALFEESVRQNKIRLEELKEEGPPF